jgi:hypothetical protein
MSSSTPSPLVDPVRPPRALSGTVRRWRIAAALLSMVLLLWGASGPLSLAVPSSCNVCHATSGHYAQWKKSTHSEVSCQDCHTERAYLWGVGNSVALTSEVWRTVFGPRGDRAWVEDEACLECHPDIGSEQAFVSNGLRMTHRGVPDGGYRCVDCHADAAHEYPAGRIPQPTMSTCAACHNNVRVTGECSTCHPAEGSSGEARRHDAEWSITHGPDWETLHGMGDLDTCTLCHPQSKCSMCHGVPLPHDARFAATHGTAAIENRAPCLTCHTAAFCNSCHGIDMPHPQGFLARHSSVATSVEDETCARCHTTANCNDCHLRHVHPGLEKPLRPPSTKK